MKGKLALLTSIFVGVLFLAFAVGTLAAKPKDIPSKGFSLPETASIRHMSTPGVEQIQIISPSPNPASREKVV